MNLVTVPDAELHLQLESGEGGAFLDHAIAMTSAKLARYTGRDDWGPVAERIEYHDGGSQYLMPRYWPIVSFGVFDDVDHVWNADTQLDATEFYATENGFIFVESGRLSRGTRNIKLVYTAGYADTAAIPATLRYAALIQLEREYNNRLRVGKTIELGMSTQPESEITPEVAALITPYVRRTGFAVV